MLDIVACVYVHDRFFNLRLSAVMLTMEMLFGLGLLIWLVFQVTLAKEICIYLTFARKFAAIEASAPECIQVAAKYDMKMLSTSKLLSLILVLKWMN